MLYCSHCGKKIDEHKIEKKRSSLEASKNQINGATEVAYVCPRCGWLIKKNLTDEDVKSLSTASHAEIQKGRNSFAWGMGMNMIAIISLILAYVFFLLSHKTANQGNLVPTCPEFVVCILFLVVGSLLVMTGLIFTFLGVYRMESYKSLLKDIQNKTFYQ
jgi:DNA-directed RNA polymerase subunit RPC12/RpoP